MPLKKRTGQNTEMNYGSSPEGTGEPLNLGVTPKEHFIASQAGVSQKLFGTDPKDKGKTDAERLALGREVLATLRNGDLSPAEMIERLRATEAKLEDGKFTQEELEEVGGPTHDDIRKLTALLGTEPDDNEVFVYMVAKAMAEKQIRENGGIPLGDKVRQGPGLGEIELISSNYDPELASTLSLDASVEDICAFADMLSTEQAQRLYIKLRHAHSEVGIGQAYGADFDVSQEIGEQITVVKAMRARLIDADGRLTARFSAKEAKEILGASNALNQTIMKFQKEITNFQRLIMVENAVKAALDTLPREAQEKYLEVLTQQLTNTQN